MNVSAPRTWKLTTFAVKRQVNDLQSLIFDQIVHKVDMPIGGSLPGMQRRKFGRKAMSIGIRRAVLLAGMAVSILCAVSAAQAEGKHKIFLSMSYIGNDWQAEAANMVKAIAAHKSLADKVDLQVQVAGPNAQRQIQQVNARQALVSATTTRCLSSPLS
ncbi:hypothetical protein SAZ10_00010 [Mesorhizobium sp. BAC0120]|uniref:hypothetical protein n=1 Tax=Mesorhizobium sp. BAC0120 TaxID=3090670 RepID=UPI00298CCD6A|nr:hypothetical protein [Mesorhizobium sp. BAC0120]MDW6020140.1 hypothetical protein [Mesorhizobium sp. BAC0120]